MFTYKKFVLILSHKSSHNSYQVRRYSLSLECQQLVSLLLEFLDRMIRFIICSSMLNAIVNNILKKFIVSLILRKLFLNLLSEIRSKCSLDRFFSYLKGRILLLRKFDFDFLYFNTFLFIFHIFSLF